MPPVEEVDCFDTAVMWACYGYDVNGQPLYLEPVELAPHANGVRWLNKVSYMKDPQGNLIGVDATAVVLQDIPIHSKMWLGKLEDWYGTGSNDRHEQYLMSVVSFDQAPEQRAQVDRRTVGLMRLHNKV